LEKSPREGRGTVDGKKPLAAVPPDTVGRGELSSFFVWGAKTQQSVARLRSYTVLVRFVPEGWRVSATNGKETGSPSWPLAIRTATKETTRSMQFGGKDRRKGSLKPSSVTFTTESDRGRRGYRCMKYRLRITQMDR